MRCRAAQQALKTFPGNKDLSLLQQQAELQDRKFQTRKAIEQRIRDIKVKINREQFSDAIELAKQTLVTFGPDPAVTQLLSSAEVEFKARENKRKQEQELETIRTLVDDGKIPEATAGAATGAGDRCPGDLRSRVGRISDEITSARNRSSAPPRPGPEPPPPGTGNLEGVRVADGDTCSCSHRCDPTDDPNPNRTHAILCLSARFWPTCGSASTARR